MNKFIFDTIPLLIFYISYKYTNDIYIATKFIVISCMLQLVWIKINNKRVDNLILFSLLLIILMGCATIFFRNDIFIKMKPTVIYFTISLSMLLSTIAFKKNIPYTILRKQIILPNRIWNIVNIIWICFFFIMGFLNIFIAFSNFFTQETWINFKVFGIPSILVLFIFIQIILLKRYIKINNTIDKKETYEK